MNTTMFAEECESQRKYLSRIALASWPARYVADCGASDLVQQTLLRAHHGGNEFRGASGRELRAWLRKILRNVILNEVRRIRSLKRGGDRRTEMALDTVPDTTASSLTELVQAEVRGVLGRALEKLRPEQAAVIRLRVFHGLTVSEIAGKLNRTDAAIQKVWSRSLATLETELRGHVRPTGPDRLRH